MSRAFVRESDNTDDSPPPSRVPLPPGVQNLITPAGAHRLQSELQELLEKKRRLLEPTQSDLPAPDERDRRALETRIRLLQSILDTLVITPPPPAGTSRIVFGATVTLRQADGHQDTYRIVGVDETDLDRGHISWRSPLARVLLTRSVGDQIQFNSPSGPQQLEILLVKYET